MKHIFLISMISLLAWSFSASAQAQQYRQRNNGSYNNSYANTRVNYSAAYRNEIGASGTFGEISSANSTTVINLAASYKNMVTRNTAFGVILDVQSASGSGSTLLGLWGTYPYFFNTNWNTNSAVFFESGAGMADTAFVNQGHAVVTTSSRQFAWQAMIGKNFPLFDKVRFTPKAGVEKIGSTDLAIVLIPLNLTLAF